MKRTTLTRRDINGKELATVQGWQADVDGVPVVLCRDFAIPRLWVCCEPRTGLVVCGQPAPTRIASLERTGQQVKQVATSRDQEPAAFLIERAADFLSAQTARQAAS
jgi:hypothetical protein